MKAETLTHPTEAGNKYDSEIVKVVSLLLNIAEVKP